MIQLIRVSLPVVVAFLAQMAMQFVDLVVVGSMEGSRGTLAIGAVGIGSAIFSWFMMFGLGIISSLDYLVAKAFGANRGEEAKQTLAQGILVAGVVGLPLMAILFFVSYQLDRFGLHAQVAAEAGPYLRALTFSLIPVLVFFAYRTYFQATGRPRTPMLILLAGNVINAVASYGLVFGKWGMPELGSVGAGVATLICRLAMVAMAYGVFRSAMGRLRLRWDSTKAREIFRIGVPAGLHLVFEVGGFAAATTLAGRLAPSELAAHNIVLNIASLTFMVPLGIGSAAAVLVGQSMGRGDAAEAVRVGWRAFVLGSGVMLFFALVMLAAPGQVLGIYSSEASVLAVGRTLIVLAAAFQVFDGIQAVLSGAFRGTSDTRTPMFANLCAHWVIGLPLGATLCFALGYGVWGLWAGLTAGLMTVAVLLVWRWKWTAAKLLACPA